MRSEIIVRDMVEDDRSFVTATWLRCYKQNSNFARRIKNNIFYSNHNKLVNRVLDRPSTKTYIAALKDDSEVILGYFVTEQQELSIAHFLYVKGPFKGMGISNIILEHSGIDLNNSLFTHWTKDADYYVNKYEGLNYDPYRI